MLDDVDCGETLGETAERSRKKLTVTATATVSYSHILLTFLNTEENYVNVIPTESAVFLLRVLIAGTRTWQIQRLLSYSVSVSGINLFKI